MASIFDFVKQECLRMDAEAKRIDPDAESVWIRLPNASSWKGPDLSLLCVESPMNESWQWTCYGWRTPGDAEGAKNGWVWAAGRKSAEREAMKFYMAKDH